MVYWSIQKFLFYLAETKCTLYCNHKLLAPFFTTDMSSPVLDFWALELQQLDIQFQHILGKKNVVPDAISKLRTLVLYQDIGNYDLATTDGNIVENIVEEVHAIKWVPNLVGYNMESSI